MITDAIVETAAQIMWDTATGPGNWDEMLEVDRDLEHQAMRAALEAVAPLIAAKALRDAAAAAAESARVVYDASCDDEWPEVSPAEAAEWLRARANRIERGES